MIYQSEIEDYLISIGAKLAIYSTNFMIDAVKREPLMDLRTEIAAQIADVIRDGKPVRICGLHGIGKTSMFKQVAGSLGLDYFYLGAYYSHVQARSIIIELQEFLDNNGFMGAKVTDNDINKYRDGVLGWLNDLSFQQNQAIIIAIDEMIGLDRPVISYLASLPKRLPYLRFVFLDHHNRFDRYRNQCFRSMQTFYLPALSLKETGELSKWLLTQANFTITDEAVATMHDLTSGRPCEIVSVCNMLFSGNFWHHNPILYQEILGEKIITAESLNRLRGEFTMHAMIYSEFLKYSLKIGSNLTKLNPGELALMLRLADGGAPTKKDDNHVKSLVNLGLIEQDEGYWIISGYILASVIEELLRDESMLRHYSRRDDQCQKSPDFDYKKKRFIVRK